MNESDLTSKEMLELLERMMDQQRAKCFKIARRLNPRITQDDLMNPFDWPEINENPHYNWEDGLLAGLQSAHAALNATLADLNRNKS